MNSKNVGFRILSLILGLICLAGAGLLVFHKCGCPVMIKVNTFIIKSLIPPGDVQLFIKSTAPVDQAVKNIIKYIFSGYSIFAIGTGLLFLCAAFNPHRMRPFIIVVMIGSVLWIGGAIWKGLSLEIYKRWWIGDAAGALVLLVLLAALFPRKKVKPGPEPGEEVGEE